MKTTKTISAKKSLKEANKEVRTLSGAIKIAKNFWAVGYKQAFAEFGLKFDDMKFETIKPLLQTNEQGEIFITRKVAKKDEGGSNIVNDKGEKQYEFINKTVKAWSVNALFTCLEQSKAKK
jgi:hypothetical protein